MMVVMAAALLRFRDIVLFYLRDLCSVCIVIIFLVFMIVVVVYDFLMNEFTDLLAGLFLIFLDEVLYDLIVSGKIP